MNTLLSGLDNIYQAQHIASPLETLGLPIDHNMIRPDFYVMGIREKDGSVERFYDTASGEIIQIHIKQILSAYTPFTELLKSLTCQNYVFLITRSGIDHIVTIADLEKSLMKAYLFTYFMMFESSLTKKLQEIPETEVERFLNRDRKARVLKIFNRKKERNEEISIHECLYFSEKIKLYLHRFPNKRLHNIEKKLNDMRNCLAHGAQLLLSFSIEDIYSTLSFIFSWEEKYSGKRQ